MKIDTTLHTDGCGYWSRHCVAVRVDRLSLGYVNPDERFGELRLHFNIRDWDINYHGLIITDDTFLKEFREYLIILGFSDEAANDVDYSEQGMQTDNYVSFDVTNVFLSEFKSHVVETSAV